MGELYLANLADGPPESINHAADQPDLVKRLHRMHDEWLEATER